MKLNQQVNQKTSYILLGVVGLLMLIMVVWYMYGEVPGGKVTAPAPDTQQQTAEKKELSDSVRGAMPDAAAVEQQLEKAQSDADHESAASDTPLPKEEAAAPEKEQEQVQAEAQPEDQEAGKAENLDAAVAEGMAQQQVEGAAPSEAEAPAAREEAAAAVEQGAEAAAGASDSVEQAAKEAAEAIAATAPQKAEEKKQVAESKPEPVKSSASLHNNKLTAINVVPTQYGVVIRLQTAVPVDHTRWDRLRSPSRVYLDMFGKFSTGVSDRDIPDNPFLKRLRIGLHKDKIRVVADLASEKLPRNIKVSKGSDRVVVMELSDFR